MKIEQSMLINRDLSLADYTMQIATGLSEIKQPTLEISGLEMIQFIFKEYNPVCETPDVFDNIDYLIINRMKFKRIKDE